MYFYYFTYLFYLLSCYFLISVFLLFLVIYVTMYSTFLMFLYLNITYLLTPGRYNPSWVLASRTILLHTVLSWAAVSIFWTPRDSRSLWMLSCHLIWGLPLGLFPSGDFSQTDFMIREWSLRTIQRAQPNEVCDFWWVGQYLETGRYLGVLGWS